MMIVAAVVVVEEEEVEAKKGTMKIMRVVVDLIAAVVATVKAATTAAIMLTEVPAVITVRIIKGKAVVASTARTTTMRQRWNTGRKVLAEVRETTTTNTISRIPCNLRIMPRTRIVATTPISPT